MKNFKTNLKLKAAIVESGYSYEEVSAQLGLTKASLSRKIAGLTRFYEEEMQLLSDILGKPVMELFFNSKVTHLITES